MSSRTVSFADLKRLVEESNTKAGRLFGAAMAEMIVLTTALSNLAETNVIAGPTGAPILIILNPTTAKNLHEEGWSKHDIKRYIFMQAGCSREEWEEEAKRIPIYNAAIPLWPDWVKNSPKIPVVADPEDIWIVVAGSDTEIAVDGIVPSHHVVRGMPVIRPITLADGTLAKRIRQFHKLFG